MLAYIAKKDVLEPFGNTDVLLYYAIAASKLKKYTPEKVVGRIDKLAGLLP